MVSTLTNPHPQTPNLVPRVFLSCPLPRSGCVCVCVCVCVGGGGGGGGRGGRGQERERTGVTFSVPDTAIHLSRTLLSFIDL